MLCLKVRTPRGWEVLSTRQPKDDTEDAMALALWQLDKLRSAWRCIFPTEPMKLTRYSHDLYTSH